MNEYENITRDEIAAELMYEDEFLEHYEALTAADKILEDLKAEEEMECGTE
jgi:hypothetical protein